jgi:hypothetical protein
LVKGIKQRHGAEQEAASVSGEFVTLVGFHQRSSANVVHDIKHGGFVEFIGAIPEVLQK